MMQKSDGNIAVIVAVVAVLLIGGFLFFRQTADTQQAPIGESMTSESEPEKVIGEQGDATEGEDIDVVVIKLTGKNFEFSEKEIKVSKGDTVRIEFTSEQGFHDWTIDEFSAATERVNAGDSTSVEFVADQVGEFEYYCSVGNHRALGMVGKLIVE